MHKQVTEVHQSSQEETMTKERKLSDCGCEGWKEEEEASIERVKQAPYSQL